MTDSKSTCDRERDEALSVMLKEYDALKVEISERLKIAFSHVAYAGAVAAFAFPTAEKFAAMDMRWFVVTLVLAIGAIVALVWVSLVNMAWVQHCGAYVRTIEDKVNKHFGHDVLGWERYASSVQCSHFLLIPRDPRRRSR